MTVLVIGLISIIAFRAFAKKPDTISGAPIKRQWDKAKQLKKADLAAFRKLLDDNEAIYCLTFQKNANDQGTKLDNGGCATTSSSSIDDATREIILVGGGLNVTQAAGFNTP
ncbi:MAG: hypothetical protein QOF72_1650, partial [Blastocatellia bacterium]|nr:hypothetical protein [Blastocatellia bacterium]